MVEPLMLQITLIFLVIMLSFANEASDVSKGIAALVGSGITNYKRAILWGTIWTIAGATVAEFFSLELVKTSAGGRPNKIKD
jgi:PiT family inorganic phosphate transporter